MFTMSNASTLVQLYRTELHVQWICQVHNDYDNSYDYSTVVMLTIPISVTTVVIIITKMYVPMDHILLIIDKGLVCFRIHSPYHHRHCLASTYGSTQYK